MDVEQDLVRVENDPADPATVVLTWAGGTCDTRHELVINADGRTLRMFRPACEGDSLGGVGHVLRLTFDAPAPRGGVRRDDRDDAVRLAGARGRPERLGQRRMARNTPRTSPAAAPAAIAPRQSSSGVTVPST